MRLACVALTKDLSECPKLFGQSGARELYPTTYAFKYFLRKGQYLWLITEFHLAFSESTPRT